MHNIKSLLKKFLKYYLLWVFFISLFLFCIVYSLYRYESITYWDGAIGNLLATWLGVISGVPIALTIERRRQYREEKVRLLRENENSKKIYQLLKDELIYNEEQLNNRKISQDSFVLEPFKCTLWEVLCESGETKLINDPIILNKLATAYYYIKIVIDIESKLYQTMRGINVQFSDGRFASQLLLEEARYFDTKLIDAISEAHESLKSKLLKL